MSDAASGCLQWSFRRNYTLLSNQGTIHGMVYGSHRYRISFFCNIISVILTTNGKMLQKRSICRWFIKSRLHTHTYINTWVYLRKHIEDNIKKRYAKGIGRPLQFPQQFKNTLKKSLTRKRWCVEHSFAYVLLYYLLKTTA